MRTYESMRALIQELEGNAAEIARVLEHNRRAQARISAGADDPVDWGALGFTSQTLYGVLENYFLRISKYFENKLPGDRWYTALVEKMSLDIPGVRPSFFTEKQHEQQVREIVRFRHRLRNLYGEDLNPRKTAEIQKTVEAFFDEFPGLHARFIETLKGVADAL
jgi:hypothetical protein